MLRRFFSYYKPYKWLFILDFSCAILVGLLELAFPIAVNQVIDRLLPQGEWHIIIWACVGLLIIYGLNTFLHFVVTYWGHKLGINIETDMRQKLFGHMQKLSFGYYDNNKTGHSISRLTKDLEEIGEVAHHGPEDVFVAVMTLLGAFLIMLGINWKLAIISFIVIPLLMIFAIHFNKKMTKTFRKMFGDVAEINSRVEDSIGGIRVVQAFANEKYEQKQFAKNNQMYRQTKLESYKIMAQNVMSNYMFMRVVTLFTLLFGTFFVINNELTYGEFVAFILLSNILLGPIQKINAVIESYPKGIAGFKRYTEIMDTEPDIADHPNAKDITVDGAISYQNVSFGYGGKENILDNISLSIQPGETVAFVGPSGAGKTTLCSLLPRFYEIGEGNIYVDGHNIQDITLQSLRTQIGIVQQDVFLFSGTIRENIAYGKLYATDEEIYEAAKKAQLDDFLRSQPEGLQTVIGERGVKLSGGQKQRLAIARMFLKNPPILILDEATSALDTETEMAIQQSLAELSKGRTTLVIAHRLATIKNADRIIVVTKEGITEQGNHEELIEQDGVYSRLHYAQFG
ncbi:multidrug ABC transporter ATP-binding protein [Alkalihalobacillus alcalophilus ATCC 27647 = CGMCC 1.3604]|uniref:Multidrug ABC transporter ATP-binding protein n=1 Tax=Alkalihalobacillus alcalophilus ATCC 27647 = CGMCC 1.3604 TaxID=1218173 RepID=A0A094WP23_ALKAL|nr:ABC transporter ATP-binding protein [Alkalihalobacillus alcalophilus]KGA98591.1 multidrug ABC transporter ATP-binding protein [Alkalihalobacillus alcalophilus ATCC 27647 = CGMCC 1.3604]MED1560434.1 ABC transporter ATP-binding protein [Alkalihalobacillus alcalophilus]THG90882.1 multidrug ABC transporter ATP-binding protein [Alkalihalobacillus alcalophilus ATCC 27647 = CGMCC 1.3604]